MKLDYKMGNKIYPEKTTIPVVVIPVLPEKKDNQKKKADRKEDRGGFLAGPSFLSDQEYDYGQFVDIMEENGVQRRNAIHPYMTEIMQSQYLVQHDHHQLYTLAEQ